MALLLDFICGEDAADGSSAAPTLLLRVITWLWLPLQAAVIVTGLIAVTAKLDWHTLYVTSIGVGAISGMFGIPVAHELMHRQSTAERTLAEVQMAMFSYAHFCIEHVEGHHVNVGLRQDPATARSGESLYEFLPRSIGGGFVHAFRLESQRLVSLGVPQIGIQNRMLRYLALQGAVYALVVWLFGLRGTIFFAAQSAVGILIIEVINYVEHYGLTRRDHEPVTDRHSWNSSHRISNWLMFNVPRHSDHHADANRPYSLLRHAGGDRQLPAGYFAMFVLALFPPLWQRVMDPLLMLESQ